MKMKIFLIITLGSSFLLTTCNDKDHYIPVFNKFKKSEILNLELKNPKQIDLRNSEYIEEISFDQSSETMGSNNILPLEKNLVSLASDNKTIRLLDETGKKILKEENYSGRGPGEYQNISGVFNDNKFIIVVDNNLNKVLRYDHELNYKDEFYLEDLNAFTSGLTVHNDELIYPIRTNDEYLFNRKNLSVDNDSLNFFFKRIISLGKKPSSYNSFIPHSSDSGSLTFVSLHMPLIFYHQKINGISLSSPDVIFRLKHPDMDIINKDVKNSMGMGTDIIQNPPPIDIETRNRRIGLSQLFNDIYHNDEWLFLVHSNNNLSLFKRTDSKMIHTNTFYFNKEDDEKFKIENVSFSFPWIYLSSRFENSFLRINITELTN
ncbi:MAG: hypothetical protein FH748_13835 [Balneolaceae bacterium]|nr:hypothetical protein [Balneolaceae bacterium]